MSRPAATYTTLATLAAIALLIAPSVLSAQTVPRDTPSKIMGAAIEYTLDDTEEEISTRPIRLLPEEMHARVDLSETTALSDSERAALSQDERALATELSEEVGIPAATWQEMVRCPDPPEGELPYCTFKDDAVLVSAFIIKGDTSRARVKVRLWYGFRGNVVEEVRELLLERKEGAWTVTETVMFGMN